MCYGCTAELCCTGFEVTSEVPQTSRNGNEPLPATGCQQSPASFWIKYICGNILTLAELLPQTSAHDAATPEVDPYRFVLFPGYEFINSEKHVIESISQWVKAFAIYTAAMANRLILRRYLRNAGLHAGHRQCQQIIRWPILEDL